MDNEVLGLIVKELNKNGVNLIKHDFSNIDTFIPENVDYCYGRTGGLPQIFDFSEHDKVFEDKIAEQKNEISMLKALIDNYRDAESKLFDENKELKQRIAELESKETETCEKEPISDDARPSIEWYDNRHQSDCIEINRLNTTIDVLVHKVEYLRQFAGLE